MTKVLSTIVRIVIGFPKRSKCGGMCLFALVNAVILWYWCYLLMAIGSNGFVKSKCTYLNRSRGITSKNRFKLTTLYRLCCSFSVNS